MGKKTPSRMSKPKARQILSDDSVRGNPLTDKQRRLFGSLASGALLKRRARRRR